MTPRTAAEIIRREAAAPEGILLHLFHGRATVDEDMDNFGTDGPTLRIHGYHVTYGDVVHVAPQRDEWMDLHMVNGCVYYDGVWYGDYSVFTPEIDATRTAEDFDPAKAAP